MTTAKVDENNPFCSSSSSGHDDQVVETKMMAAQRNKDKETRAPSSKKNDEATTTGAAAAVSPPPDNKDEAPPPPPDESKARTAGKNNVEAAAALSMDGGDGGGGAITNDDDEEEEPKNKEEEPTSTNKDHPTTDDKKREASSSSSFPARPVKRARTAYFIFIEDKRALVQKEHPNESVATIARHLGQLWAGLNVEEKAHYQELAAQERERVAKDLQAWKDAGGEALLAAQDPAANANANIDSLSLVYPVARIRKICKLDPDVRGLSKEAVVLVTKAAELATALLGKEAVKVAQIQNRRKLLPEDVAQVCSGNGQFAFLKEDVADLARRQQQQAQEQKKLAQQKKAADKQQQEEEAAPSYKSLTAYFAPKKTAN